ncbi:MAG: ribosome small subunit-dependent GTPase A [Oscillospiraceae bacterium]|jgi:ribosome biogenesis GTPase|nr:ribosome small subunit-dependent GTPase A [Oscillospiraceae bacterium]
MAAQGTLLSGIGGFYTALADDGTVYTLRPRGKLRRDTAPLAGDRIEMTPGEGERHGWLERILPRRTVLTRPPVANLELLILVIAPKPEPDMMLIDRLAVIARRANIDCLICVNKRDLDPSLGLRVAGEYAQSGMEIMSACALEPSTLDALRGVMAGRLCCMAGQSGTGKSTILNTLLNRQLKTGGVSPRTERGRHTTRQAELLIEGELRVLDTPGFSLLTLEDVPPAEVREVYPEFEGYSGACRFQPCMHDKEPDCAVTAALTGTPAQARLNRYRLLLAEAREAERNRYR